MEEQPIQTEQSGFFGILVSGRKVNLNFNTQYPSIFYDDVQDQAYNVPPELRLHQCVTLENANEINFLTIFSINAPQPAEGFEYGVFVQFPASEFVTSIAMDKKAVFLGSLAPGRLSITQSINRFIKKHDVEFRCMVHVIHLPTVLITNYDAQLIREPNLSLSQNGIDEHTKSIMSQIAIKLANDIEMYCSSHESIEREGQSYIDTNVVNKWIAQFDTRIRSNGKFWANIE